jgi:hypothetical protein
MFGDQSLFQGRLSNNGFSVVAPEGPDYGPPNSIDVHFHADFAGWECGLDSVLLVGGPEGIFS